MFPGIGVGAGAPRGISAAGISIPGMLPATGVGTGALPGISDAGISIPGMFPGAGVGVAALCGISAADMSIPGIAEDPDVDARASTPTALAVARTTAEITMRRVRVILAIEDCPNRCVALVAGEAVRIAAGPGRKEDLREQVFLMTVSWLPRDSCVDSMKIP